MSIITKRRRHKRSINEINMVPFIDVMLVLLVIFMVTAPLITPSLIDLPQVGQADQVTEEIVQVEIDKEANVKIRFLGNEQITTLDSFIPVVQASQEQIWDLSNPVVETDLVNALNIVPVVISADKNIRYDTVMRVMGDLQRAGVQRVGLSVQTDRSLNTP
jgi:biopolymer transport protein TolR